MTDMVLVRDVDTEKPEGFDVVGDEIHHYDPTELDDYTILDVSDGSVVTILQVDDNGDEYAVSFTRELAEKIIHQLNRWQNAA